VDSTQSRVNDIPAEERALFKTLVGLAGEGGRVRGIASSAIAEVAGLPDRRTVTPLAQRLADRGLIELERGNFRQANTYRVTYPVPADWRERIARCVRPRLTLALRRAPAAAAA
jgi:hypothetical protein